MYHDTTLKAGLNIFCSQTNTLSRLYVFPVEASAKTAAAAVDRKAVSTVPAIPAAWEPRVGGGSHEAVPGAAAVAEVPAEATGAVGLVPEIVLQANSEGGAN